MTLWMSLYDKLKDTNKCTKTLFIYLSKYLNSEDHVEDLLSFKKVALTINAEYEPYLTYDIDSNIKPFYCTNNKGNDYIPVIENLSSNKSLSVMANQKSYFDLYKIIAQTVSLTSKNRQVKNNLVTKEYIDKLYKQTNSNIHQLLYKSAKQLP